MTLLRYAMEVVELSEIKGPQQKEMALSESKKGYVRDMEHYLRTGDWISQFMGAKENERTVWTCTAIAYHADDGKVTYK